MKKSNKSLMKRIKVTKKSGVLVRPAGIAHFNAKTSRAKQLKRRTHVKLALSNKDKARYISK